ncbi:hypothetical protein [Paenibacillus sp. TH7-28]
MASVNKVVCVRYILQSSVFSQITALVSLSPLQVPLLLPSPSFKNTAAAIEPSVFLDATERTTFRLEADEIRSASGRMTLLKWANE